MLKVVVEQGRPAPRIFCDWCHLTIQDLSKGSYLYQAAGSGQPLDGTVYYTHDACQSAFQANSGDARRWILSSLETLLRELGERPARLEDLDGQPSTLPEGAKALVLPIEIARRLNTAQQKAYRAALLANGITLSNYQAITDRSFADSKQDLAMLMELGLFEQRGRGKSTLYVPVLHPRASVAGQVSDNESVL